MMNLCDILSRDCDACPTATETAAISAARASLERRWKNICDKCLQRKQRSRFVTVYCAYLVLISDMCKSN